MEHLTTVIVRYPFAVNLLYNGHTVDWGAVKPFTLTKLYHRRPILTCAVMFVYPFRYLYFTCLD